MRKRERIETGAQLRRGERAGQIRGDLDGAWSGVDLERYMRPAARRELRGFADLSACRELGAAPVNGDRGAVFDAIEAHANRHAFS